MPVPVAVVLRVAELPTLSLSSSPKVRGMSGRPFAFYSMKVLEQNLVRFHDHDEKDGDNNELTVNAATSEGRKSEEGITYYHFLFGLCCAIEWESR